MTDPRVLEAHGKHAQSVCFPKKHNVLVSAGMDAKVHVWARPDFERIDSFEGHGNSVNTLSFNPDETLLATGSSDQTVKIWSFPAGKVLHTIEKQGYGSFSPDGEKIATIGANGRITLWDTTEFATQLTLPAMDKRVFTLAFSPDQQWLVVGGTGTIHRYNLQEQELESSLEGHQYAVPSVLFTPDGEYLLATGAEGALSIWQVPTWNEVARVSLPGKGVLQMALTPDGGTVYVSMDNKIAAYTIPAGDQTHEIELPIKGVYGVAISPDGTMLANAGADGKVRIWER